MAALKKIMLRVNSYTVREEHSCVHSQFNSHITVSESGVIVFAVDYCWGQTTTRVSDCFSVQFVCVDGSRCPPLVNNRNGVCDGVQDCRDRSDEARCGLGE